MPENKKKYVVNVDFPTTSKVHLNPHYFDSMWCRLNEEKKRKDGGKVYMTREEARKYLDEVELLFFDGKPVTHLAKCRNCSERCRQRVHWDI